MILPLDYKQTDQRWKNLDYSAKGEKTTIGRSGCGPSAVADILAAWIDPSITPATECAWSLRHGYKAPNQGTYYQYVDAALNRYGIKTKRLTSSSIYEQPNHHAITEGLAALSSGRAVLVACMGKGTWTRSGHFITPYKLDAANGKIYTRDPASNNPNRLTGDLSTWRRQVKQLWIVYYPDWLPGGETTKNNNGKKVEDLTKKETQALIDAAIEAERKNNGPVYYEKVEDVPYEQDLIRELVNRGILRGTGDGLHLSEDLLRAIVILYRMLTDE